MNAVRSASGACWAFIQERFQRLRLRLLSGTDERWRVNLAFVLMIVALDPDPVRQDAVSEIRADLSAIYPLIAYWLLLGGWGLTPVETHMHSVASC